MKHELQSQIQVPSGKQVNFEEVNVNSIGYKVMLTEKYSNMKQYFRVYQTRGSGAFAPFEEAAYNTLTNEQKQKF